MKGTSSSTVRRTEWTAGLLRESLWARAHCGSRAHFRRSALWSHAADPWQTAKATI